MMGIQSQHLVQMEIQCRATTPYQSLIEKSMKGLHFTLDP